MLQLRCANPYVFERVIAIADVVNSMSLMFSAAAFAGAFSGLLAAAIIHMDGVGGRPGWAWVFILVRCFRLHCSETS